MEFMFPLQNDATYACTNLQDAPDVQCEAMFRYKLFAFLGQLSFMVVNLT